MTSKFSLGMLERIEAEESADVRRLRRLPVTVPKMRVIILSRPFLFLGIEKAELRKEAPLKKTRVMVESGYLGNYIYALQILSEYVWIVFP